jgi:hypothetical protein
MARITLDEIRAIRPRVDRTKIDATTDTDIAGHMIEDGENPGAELGNFVRDSSSLTKAYFVGVPRLK